MDALSRRRLLLDLACVGGALALAAGLAAWMPAERAPAKQPGTPRPDLIYTSNNAGLVTLTRPRTVT